MVYILILIVGAGNAQTMTSLSRTFAERADCQSAGEAFNLEAKKEYAVRYYCVPAVNSR